MCRMSFRIYFYSKFTDFQKLFLEKALGTVHAVHIRRLRWPNVDHVSQLLCRENMLFSFCLQFFCTIERWSDGFELYICFYATPHA